MFTLISPLTGKMEAWETPALGDIPTQDALFAVDMEREITSLHIPKKVWAVGKGAPKYRVFKTHTESVTVEAATAVEAIAASGVAHPIKILRGEMDIGNVVANAILGATK